MERIGIRELQQHASRWVRRVRNGESFEVTDRGHLVALLVPVSQGRLLDRLVALGAARPPLRPVELMPTIEDEGRLSTALAQIRREDDR